MVNATNLTNVTNFLELIEYSNASASGLLGIGFLIILTGVIFLAVKVRMPFSHSLVISSFAGIIGSLMLQVVGLASWEATGLFGVLFAIGLTLAYLDRREY